MNIHNLLIPASKYTHHYNHPELPPLECSSEPQTITAIAQPVAFCNVITFASAEHVIVLSIGYGHSTSLVCTVQSADSVSEEMFRYEHKREEEWNALKPEIVGQVARLITHSAIYEQHKELIFNFVKKYIF